MTADTAILKELKNLRNDVARLRQELVKQHQDEWISGVAVMTLTGWDSKKLRKLRDQELVPVKREGNKVRYSKQRVLELKEKIN